MIQEIDLQAQMHDKGESDKAFLAYEIYKGLGEKRTLLGAYNAYRNTNRKAKSEKAKTSIPQNFSDWSKKFNWADRVRDWDNKKLQRIQSEQLEADREEYIKVIENGRSQLQRVATMAMNLAELQLAIGYRQMQLIAKDSPEVKMAKHEATLFQIIAKTNKDSVETLAAAKTELFDAMGLVQTVEQLSAINSDG